MDLGIKGRRAIVTGGGSGIGFETARQFLEEGVRVLIAGRTADKINKARDDLARKTGGEVHAVQADMTKEADIKRMVDTAKEKLGGVDILVNNAGVIQPGLSMLADTDDELFDRLVSINLKGTFNTMRAAAKRLRRRGRIVNFSSSVKTLALPGYSVYAATKAAVETLTNIFAKELRGRDIAVNAVAPGPTATELFLKDKTPEQIEHLAKMPPMERLAQPEDIANVVAFLVGPDAGWVDGQTLRVNGGIV
jgi:3-oxoacyl-[acyl-carrier protein] reductase